MDKAMSSMIPIIQKLFNKNGNASFKKTKRSLWVDDGEDDKKPKTQKKSHNRL